MLLEDESELEMYKKGDVRTTAPLLLQCKEHKQNVSWSHFFGSYLQHFKKL